MTQSRRLSLIESISSTAIGFVISVSAWPAISFHVLHRAPVVSEGLTVVGIYTLISIVRGYVVRRAFIRLHWFGPAPGCQVCGKPATCRRPARFLCDYHGGR